MGGGYMYWKEVVGRARVEALKAVKLDTRQGAVVAVVVLVGPAVLGTMFADGYPMWQRAVFGALVTLLICVVIFGWHLFAQPPKLHAEQQANALEMTRQIADLTDDIRRKAAEPEPVDQVKLRELFLRLGERCYQVRRGGDVVTNSAVVSVAQECIVDIKCTLGAGEARRVERMFENIWDPNVMLPAKTSKLKELQLYLEGLSRTVDRDQATREFGDVNAYVTARLGQLRPEKDA